MGVNTLPERLTAFRVYMDGSSDLKGVADVELPKFESMKETVKGAGIAGEYDSPTLGHFGAMQVGLTWRTLEKNLLTLMRQQAQRLDLRGAFQDYDAGMGAYVTRSVRIVVQGVPISTESGKFEVGATSGSKSTIEVLYIKISIEGKTIVELDKLNYICIIDGVDYLKDIRKALGL